MKSKKHLLILIFLFGAFTSYSQKRITPYFTYGYMQFLKERGSNTEIGVELQLHKRFDIISGYRYTNQLKNRLDETAFIKGISTFFTFSPINGRGAKLMIGPGFTLSKIERFFYDGTLEKSRKSVRADIAKLRYEQKLANLRLGIDITYYRDDGMLSHFIGFVVGYQFKTKS